MLGFFADSDRVSFHWPLAGWLALACAAPVVLATWRPATRFAVFALAAAGLAAIFAYFTMLAFPQGRERLAAGTAYADNFSGWHEVADAVRADLATMPPGTRVVADNFMLAAQLALALDRDDIHVLAHPLNVKHGRAVQLAEWGLLSEGRADWGDAPVLLVVEDTARPLKRRLEGYRELCTKAGHLPPPLVLNVDHGRKRFLRFRPERGRTGCAFPAMAWVDIAPVPSTTAQFELVGWALKAGSGVSKVVVTVDGVDAVVADYGQPRGDVLTYWGLATEGADDRVGFRARLDLQGRAPGTAWIGLVIHGRDGSVEAWPEQPLHIE